MIHINCVDRACGKSTKKEHGDLYSANIKSIIVIYHLKCTHIHSLIYDSEVFRHLYIHFNYMHNLLYVINVTNASRLG